MGVDMKVKAIYDSEIGNITRSQKRWKGVLKVAGQLYRYEFDNIVMVTAQRPPEKSTLMADYDTWKKVGRYVKRGAKGCAIFPSRALNPRMRYIFDISDTGGKDVKLTWDLEGENLKNYADFLVDKGQMEASRSLELSYAKSMRLVVLPQAIRTMIPSIINQFIITLKDTSILSVIGFPELTNMGKTISGNTFKSLQTWAIVGLMYMIVIVTLSKIAKKIERRVSRGR